MLRPPPQPAPARGEGPGGHSLSAFPPHTLRGAPRGGSAGRRGRPRAVPRQEGAGAGARRLPRGGGGDRSRQAASPLKAAPTSPARGPQRACAARLRPAARPRGPASWTPPPPLPAQARWRLLRAGLGGCPGAPEAGVGARGVAGDRGRPSPSIPGLARGWRRGECPGLCQALAGLDGPHGGGRAADLVVWLPGLL